MSKKYPAGIITKSPVTPTGPYQDGVASGVWTMEQMEYWMKQGLWPVAGNANPGDPYYKYVTMLLTGNGTNGAQNNTFLDSSANALTITRNGNTTQGSFSPYGTLWSNYFNGSSVLRDTGYNNAFDGNFTMEYWWNPSATWTGYNCHMGDNGYNGPTGAAWFGLNGTTWTMQFDSGTTLTFGTASYSVGTWYHIALVRSSNTIKLYVNGVQQGSSQSNSETWRFYDGISVGGYSDVYPIKSGYLSNFRMVAYTAIYTSNFTPPTSPLTNISYTQILTCQSNRFVDNSSNNIQFYQFGTPSVQRFSPFNPTASYSTATIGGSGYFDGSGDYLKTPSTGNFAPTGDFTIACWFYPKSNYNYQGIIGQWGGGIGDYWLWDSYSDGHIVFYVNGGGATRITTSAGALIPNQWHYIVMSRSGSTVTAYINGVSQGTTSYSGTLGSSSHYIEIGGAAGDYSTGYISDVRLVDGTAISATPPTAPLTAVSGTSLLLNMTNAGIPDSAMMNDLETVGNAQVSTSVKKFGTGSLKFSGSSGGTTDCILASAPASPLYSPSSSFTVEFWIYPLGTGDTNQYWVGNYNGGNNGWDLRYQDLGNAVNGVSYENTASSKVIGFTSSAISSNTWQFITASWDSSGNCYVFVNGVLLRTLTSFSTTTNDILNIGRQRDVSNRFFQGYIDDLRITKGYARYTSNFTAPTAPFYTY